MAVDPAIAPRLIAYPTMTVEALFASAEAPLHRPPSGETAYLQPEGPHTWVLRAGDRDVAFPPGRFTSIETFEGRIVRILSDPQMEYLDPKQCVSRAADVRKQLADAGFLEADVFPEDALESEVRTLGGVRACRFRGPGQAGEWMGEVRVERMIEAGSDLAKILRMEEDACLVKITIWDIRGAAAMIG